MLNQLKYGCVLLFALPAIALARPVTITTHTTGLVTIDNTVMEGLGAFNFPATGPMPYAFTLHSSFDDGGYTPERGTFFYTGPVDVAIDFHVGNFDYHYADSYMASWRLSTVDAATDRFEHVIDMTKAGQIYELFEFTQAISIPSGSLGADTLTPGHVESSTTSDNGYASIFYSDPMWSGTRATMTATVDTYSVDVTSPVPEPASYAMLAAGVATLVWRRRTSRRASTAAA